MKKALKSLILGWAVLMLASTLMPAFALAEEAQEQNDGWVNFFLICNEGMVNGGGNSGNTMMVVAMHPESGKIRLMMFTWDTFVHYEGYDLPQKIDMPYRNEGPEGTLKVFDENFGLDIHVFMSLNFLNLASLIDTYGGVDVDITRAERNALNGMVASKHEALQAQADTGLLSQAVVEMLAKEDYLNDYGPDTHLNGLQAVGFGWLQYDSVYNCCERDVEVIANLFESVAKTINSKVVFYTDDADEPEEIEGRRAVNLDALTDDDFDFLRELVDPIFQKSEHNLTEEEIHDISLALAHTAYTASRQGLDIFDSLDCAILPLEATDEYDVVGGVKGHLVDVEANTAAMRAFLYAEDDE